MAERSIVAPLVLIAVGGALLLWNFGWVPPEIRDVWLRWWPLVLLAIGAGFLARAAAVPPARARAIVPGVVLAIYGAFFLLIPLGVLAHGDVGRYWGIFPGAVGAALVVRRAVVPGRDRSLVPAIVLLAVGAVGISGEAFRFDGRYWPLILVAIGAFLLLRRR